MSATNFSIPDDFHPLPMEANPFIAANGPLYGRWVDHVFTLGFKVEPRHCNPGNTCHGGMLMTLADMTLLVGSNLQAQINQYLLTVNMSNDFLGPAVAGDWVEGQCEVLRASKNMVFAQGILRVASKPILRFNGLFKPTGEPNSRPGLQIFFGQGAS
jgi:uncharacterized protein (TIGR00369 family)